MLRFINYIRCKLLSILSDKKGELLYIETVQKIMICVVLGALLLLLSHKLFSLIEPNATAWWYRFVEYADSFMSK